MPRRLVAEGEVGETFDDGLRIEQRFDVVMAQVGDDGNDLYARLVGGDLEFGRHREVQGYGRTVAPRGEGKALDRRVGQHGDLVARHIDRRQPVARDRVERRAGNDAEAGRCNMYTDAPANARQRLQREGVVDLGRRRVVDRKGGDIGARQALGQCGKFDFRETGAGREILVEETLEVVVVCRADRAAAVEQVQRGDTQLAARGFERLGLETVAVGLAKQLVEQRLELGRQAESLQLANHAFDR